MFSQSIIVAALVAFVQAQATCQRSYTVVDGDICDKISASQKVSTFQLAALNTNVDAACNNLQPGLQLCLGADPSQDCTTTHVVQDGDSCDQISSTYGTNITLLTMNNPQLDQACDIYVGEVLCVASQVQVPPASASLISALQSESTDLPYCDEL